MQRLNASIANAVAGGSWRAKPCLLGALLPRHAEEGRPAFTLRWAVGGACRFAHVWPVMCEVADDVLTDAYARLKLCKCDL